MRHRRPRLAALCVLLAFAATGCTHRGESGRGAGMRATMNDATGIDRTASESPRYHRYDP